MNDHRTALDTALRQGMTPKEFAHTVGISVSWAYRLAWELGFQSVYISYAERKLINELRLKTQRSAAN